MCICCASAEFAFEKMHMIEPRTKKIKPQLDLTVSVWLSIEVSIVCGLIFGCG